MNKLQKFKKEKNPLITESEVESKLDLLIKGQEISSTKLEDIGNDLRKGFIGLALRNEELNQKLEIAVSELNGMKKEREEKAARREKWANRKRFPKRDPVNAEVYNLLIKESEGPTYIATRTRIAICLLTVTGIRIGELLSLKVGQLETLVEEGPLFNRSIEKRSCQSQSFFNFRREKNSKGSKKRF